jgi:adenylate kinase
MVKQVILISGTPCVGKTSVAHYLTPRLDALYVNLTDLATHENLILGKDEERNTTIVDEVKMKRRINQIVTKSDKQNIIIDGHYAVNVVPTKLVTRVFVLRRDPVELRKFMTNSGYSERKLNENLASEILDVCLIDAINAVGATKVCELNITGKTVEETSEEILSLIVDPSKCVVGIVDWLGKLEKEGLLDKYLKTWLP